MNWTQRQLKMFVTTAALGHVTRASEALHISQPALTRALKEFEAQLGTVLFERTTRRLALTHEGRQLLPLAQRLLRDMDTALDTLRGPSGQVHGSVTLAVGTAFGCTVLPRAVERLMRTHPGLRLRVLDDNSAGITARVQRSEADLGIGTPVGDTSALTCERLLSAPIGLLGQAGRFGLRRSASHADLARLPLLKEPADTSIVHTLSLHGSDLVALMAGGVEVSNLALQLSMAQAGVGVAVLSALGASHPQASGLTFVPLRPRVAREVFLMHRRDQPPSPAARALAQALRECLRTVSGLHPGVSIHAAG